MYFAALLAFQITDGINLYECFPLKKDIFGCLRTSVGARAFLVPLLRKNLVNLSPAAPHVLIEDTLSFLTSAILNQVSFDASYHLAKDPFSTGACFLLHQTGLAFFAYSCPSY